MKKLMFMASGIALCLSAAQAQDFKQKGGDNNLQLLFAPFGSNPISLNEGITYRRFLKDGTMAVRLSLSVNSSKHTDVLQQADDTLSFPKQINYYSPFPGPDINLVTGMNPEANLVTKESGFSIRPGFEKHLAGTERLSPYFGAEIVFSSSKTKMTRDTIVVSDFTTTLTDTISNDVTISAPWTTRSLGTTYGSKTFGVNLIAGMDYYFTKNLSLGAEFGFGFYSTKYTDYDSDFLKVTDTAPIVGPDPNGVYSATVTHSTTVESNPSQKRGKDSGFGPVVTARIKLGWLF